MGGKPRDLIDPVVMNAEQVTSAPNKQDLSSEEIQKLAMQIHLEIQQGEDSHRDLAERRRFVSPIFKWAKLSSTGEQTRAKFSKDEHLENE